LKRRAQRQLQRAEQEKVCSTDKGENLGGREQRRQTSFCFFFLCTRDLHLLGRPKGRRLASRASRKVSTRAQQANQVEGQGENERKGKGAERKRAPNAKGEGAPTTTRTAASEGATRARKRLRLLGPLWRHGQKNGATVLPSLPALPLPTTPSLPTCLPTRLRPTPARPPPSPRVHLEQGQRTKPDPPKGPGLRDDEDQAQVGDRRLPNRVDRYVEKEREAQGGNNRDSGSLRKALAEHLPKN
jgi:hypothetical protein